MKPGSSSATGMHPVNDRSFRIARSLAARDWEKPKDLQRARHMAHDGAGLAEIMEALGWDVFPATARRRLKKYNIIARNRSDRAHRGEETSLPPCERISFETYRPRTRAA